MSARRWPPSPALSSSTRASIDPSFYTSIDSVLKDLKSCSRRLRTSFSAHHDELRLLERLYYKGKNQHRSALFWKKAAEMKRYGERLHAMALPDTFALFHCSFFGATSALNPQSMRGSWTHVPDNAYVVFLMERLQACLILVNKFRQRLLEIYRSFKLTMQSGAFAPLILMLAAVASRMNALIPEFQHVVWLCWTTSHRMLLILDPCQAQKVKPIHVYSADAHCENVCALDEPGIKASFDEIIPAEDTGSAVTRSTTSPLLIQNTVDKTAPHALSVAQSDPIIISNDTPRFPTDMFSLPTVSGQYDVERKVVPKQGVTVDKLSKKTKRRNEIDDIFGF